MDIPQSDATYLHRVGRTGRFGTQGLVITLSEDSGEELAQLRAIARRTCVNLYEMKIVPGVALPSDVLLQPQVLGEEGLYCSIY